mmetsp:Transcript_12141/g.48763  ORF Transcript_12141/g.48763 Transcript_12141/m.48763 type:complete len:288 (+) Transcript_12141:2643-3506(+)
MRVRLRHLAALAFSSSWSCAVLPPSSSRTFAATHPATSSRVRAHAISGAASTYSPPPSASSRMQSAMAASLTTVVGRHSPRCFAYRTSSPRNTAARAFNALRSCSRLKASRAVHLSSSRSALDSPTRSSSSFVSDRILAARIMASGTHSIPFSRLSPAGYFGSTLDTSQVSPPHKPASASASSLAATVSWSQAAIRGLRFTSTACNALRRWSDSSVREHSSKSSSSSSPALFIAAARAQFSSRPSKSPSSSWCLSTMLFLPSRGLVQLRTPCVNPNSSSEPPEALSA